MGIAISADHVELARIARSALESKSALNSARASLDESPDPKELWDLVSELGWLGLHVEERWGGQGGGLTELFVILEELGRCVAPGPFLSTVLVSAVIQESGTEEQRARWLPELVNGTTPAALGLRTKLTLESTSVTGDAGYAVSGDEAELLLLALGEDLILVRNDDTTVIEGHRDVDTTRSLAAISCSASPVLDTFPGAAPLAHRLALAFASVEAVGGMHAVTEAAVAYVKIREQFGKPVGSFMAVKHHCAGMLVDTELATAAAWDASRETATTDEAELVTSIAAGLALPGFLRLARLNIQLHGGIAFTWEHTAHLYLRRAMALAAAFGRPEHALERVTALTRSGVERRGAFDLPPEAEDFRSHARAFVTQHLALPEAERRRHISRSGYLVPHWPPPFGRGAGTVEQIVIDEELQRVDRPGLGLGGWVLPSILLVATPDQIERWIWPAVDGETRWCQLFSEPGAGSDAAAVSTRGTKVEGGWKLNGQKVWSSEAHSCQWGLATIRTNTEVAKHAGITAMAIKIDAPGVTVRPLREITGDALFNEVFFDDVFVPDSDVVGEVGGGWGVAISTLGFERVSIGSGFTSILARELVPILDRYAPEDLGLATELGALISESDALMMINQRSALKVMASSTPGAEGTVAKLVGAEHQQHVTALGLRIVGDAALTGAEPRLVRDSFYTRCLTLAGGTSEIVRTTIAERILKLPREK